MDRFYRLPDVSSSYLDSLASDIARIPATKTVGLSGARVERIYRSGLVDYAAPFVDVAATYGFVYSHVSVCDATPVNATATATATHQAWHTDDGEPGLIVAVYMTHVTRTSGATEFSYKGTETTVFEGPPGTVVAWRSDLALHRGLANLTADIRRIVLFVFSPAGAWLPYEIPGCAGDYEPDVQPRVCV